jgi:hypothetical protein
MREILYKTLRPHDFESEEELQEKIDENPDFVNEHEWKKGLFLEFGTFSSPYEISEGNFGILINTIALVQTTTGHVVRCHVEDIQFLP